MSYSTECRPRAVKGRGTGEDTLELWLEAGNSSSTSLAELAGREVKGFSPTCPIKKNPSTQEKYNIKDRRAFLYRKKVFCIRKALIQMWICRSVPLDTALFYSDFQGVYKMGFFPPSLLFIIAYITEGTVHLYQSLKSHKGRNQRFFQFFGLLMEGSESVQIIMDPEPGGPKAYGF